MHKHQGKTVFSAGDVVVFLDCEHATTLALQDLETPLAPADDDESLGLIQQKGFAHDDQFLSSLKANGLGVAEPPSNGALAKFAHAIEQAMQEHEKYLDWHRRHVFVGLQH